MTHGSSSSPSSSSSVGFWSQEYQQSQRHVDVIGQDLGRFPTLAPLRVSRVAQLDANLLDNELETILVAPVWKALDLVTGPGRQSYQAEMMALLRIAVLKLSLYDKGQTYGSGLQNLKYRNEWSHQRGALQSTAVDSRLLTFQKASYMTLQVLPSYLLSKTRDAMLSSAWSDEPLPSHWWKLFDLRRFNTLRRDQQQGHVTIVQEWKRICWQILNSTENVINMAGLINFLVFLYDGRYRTLVDRMLGMRLIYAQRSITPNVSFEFLNRQLVWEAFTEFIMFLMPLINISKLRRKLLNFLNKRIHQYKSLKFLILALPNSIVKHLNLLPKQSLIEQREQSIEQTDKLDKTTRPKGTLHFLSNEICPICYSSSNLPPTSLPRDPTRTDSDRQSTTLGDMAMSSNHSTNNSTAAAAAAAIGGSTNTNLTNGRNEDNQVKIPYETDCGWKCKYCYYCIVTKLIQCQEEGENEWICLRCGSSVHGVVRESIRNVDQVDDFDQDNGVDDDDEEEEEEEEEEGDNEAKKDQEQESKQQAPATESISSEHERWR
ncbi:peroxisome assembly protein (Peroxin-2) [Microbotryomycetes sp. JL221]|nr:peroxisome assembly protein (Peroxin-2) [Microbotryomycetes sp. JL221]